MDVAFLNGIDVSHYDGPINWNQVTQDSSGIVFAYAKASEGTSLKDPRFAENYAGIKAQGLLRGAYHYFHPNKPASAQAELFLSMAPKPDIGDLPPALDIEVTDGATPAGMLAGVQAWLDVVGTAWGCAPVIYTSASFWSANVKDAGLFSSYRLWVAEYTNALAPVLPLGATKYTFWQYSETGRIDGIAGATDMNRFKGSLDDLKKLVVCL